MYTVVILSASRGPLRDKLGEVLDRSFSIGAGSFILKSPEAVRLVLKYGRGNDQELPVPSAEEGTQ